MEQVGKCKVYSCYVDNNGYRSRALTLTYGSDGRQTIAAKRPFDRIGAEGYEIAPQMR